MLPFAGDGTEPGLRAVAEQDHGVVVEQVRNGVPVVGVVLLKRGLKIAVDILALDKQQRQSVHKADNIGPPAIQVAPHP